MTIHTDNLITAIHYPSTEPAGYVLLDTEGTVVAAAETLSGAAEQAEATLGDVDYLEARLATRALLDAASGPVEYVELDMADMERTILATRDEAERAAWAYEEAVEDVWGPLPGVAMARAFGLD